MSEPIKDQPDMAENRIRQASTDIGRMFIPIDQLRQRSGLTYHAFDRTLLRLARQQKIQLLHGDPRGRRVNDLLHVPGEVPNLPYVCIQWL